jgi:type IV secretory pathway TrbL component
VAGVWTYWQCGQVQVGVGGSAGPLLVIPCFIVFYAAMLVRGLAQQAWSVIQLSQTGTLHTGQNTACAWHPALSRHSLQASAIAPHAIACSPVGSISGTTEKSQRSSLAGMAGNYTPESNPLPETSI